MHAGTAGHQQAIEAVGGGMPFADGWHLGDSIEALGYVENFCISILGV